MWSPSKIFNGVVTYAALKTVVVENHKCKRPRQKNYIRLKL